MDVDLCCFLLILVHPHHELGKSTLTFHLEGHIYIHLYLSLSVLKTVKPPEKRKRDGVYETCLLPQECWSPKEEAIKWEEHIITSRIRFLSSS